MNEQPSTARIALKWGGILGLVLMVITLAMYLTDQTTNQWFSVLTAIAMVTCLALAMRDFRSQNGGYMSYGEGLGTGSLLSGVAGLLSAAFITFYNVVIDPTIQQRAFEQVREKLEEQGNLSDEQIEQAVEFRRSFSHRFYVYSGVFGTLIMGFLLSLIVAAFIRRNKANPFE